MEDNQQFIEGLRDKLSKFFKLYDEYNRASTTHEKVKALEDIASLFYGVANELWIKTAPLEEQTITNNIAEQVLPPINAKEEKMVKYSEKNIEKGK